MSKELTHSEVEGTIAFVDLAGFTALTEAHGDRAAMDLIDSFVAMTRTAVAAADAELVKAIGDAVMLAASNPLACVEAVRRLFHACDEADGFPEPRAGLHHGPVITRDGDYYGATVNLAARATSHAGSGQGFATRKVADAARLVGVDVQELGPYRLRNVRDPVVLWSLDLCAEHVDRSVDPVCRMQVSCRSAIGRIRHGANEHWFCSLACIGAFVADPDLYVDSQTDR